ncbi:MAG: oxidoreductase [Candidatus Cloacimonadota bacterium]|nr:MAG: oxidoreductase [Candidatus Cloacimonadota bacterium]
MLILIQLLIAVGITAFLSLMLVVAEMLFANYGECEIDINKGEKKLKVKGGSSLLSSLAENNIFIPSACGGRGSCGFCKLKVVDGGGPLLPTEKPFLSPAEIKDNVRLSCQVKVKNDLRIQVPEELFAIKQFKARVKKIENYTYDIKGLTFELLEPDSIHFKAGQYMQLSTVKYGKVKQSVSRAYSISSNPNNPKDLQLIIRRVPDGICTTWVHDYLKENDEVKLTGPFGDFYIRDTDNDIVFIAGGSGKAPIKSMIENLYDAGCERKMTYFFGARAVKDLYLTDYLKSYEDKLKEFTYVPILSSPEKDDNWQGRTGFIMPHFGEFIKHPAQTEAYLCGSPGMINAVSKGLTDMGVPEDQIYYDSF